MGSNYKRLVQNIGVFTIANFTSRILNFLILPLYTYYLSTEEYGTIDLVNTAIMLLFPVFSLSITDAVMRFGISDPDNRKDIFTFGIRVICIGTLPVLLIAAVLLMVWHNASLAVCFAAIYFVQALNSLFGAYAKAINRTKEMASITTVISIGILAFNVYFVAIARMGITGYWVATILGNLIGIVLYLVVCRLYREVSFKMLPGSRELFGKMLLYAVPLIPNALFWWINSSLDRWVLRFLAGMSIVGLYSCANKIPTILSTINTVFSQAWNLSLFQSYEGAERDRFFKETYYYFREVMFCCSIGIIWLSKFVASFMFSKDFFSAWVFIPLLTFGLFYNTMNSFIGSLFTASKQTKYIFTTTLVGAVVNFGLNFPMVFLWGAQGAAMATLLSYAVVWLMRQRRAFVLFGMKADRKAGVFQTVFLIVETVLVLKDIWKPVSVIVVFYCIIFGWKVLKKMKEHRREKHQADSRTESRK